MPALDVDVVVAVLVCRTSSDRGRNPCQMAQSLLLPPSFRTGEATRRVNGVVRPEHEYENILLELYNVAHKDVAEERLSGM